MKPRCVLALARYTLVAGLCLNQGGCEKTSTTKVQSPDTSAQTGTRPGQAGSRERLLLRGGRVMTATGIIYERGDVLITGDRISAVGVGLTAPAGTRVVDVSGKTVTPGIIDTHSHMGVYPSPGLKAHADGNEATEPNTAYVRSADGFWPQDPQIDYARAGGVTTAQILPGSANLIGGRSVTIKLYPEIRSVDDARFQGAPDGLKMACGENPKRVYGDKSGPQTRMGNVAGYRKAFAAATAYRQKYAKYQESLEQWEKKGDGKVKDRPDPPDRDLGLETLAEVLDGKILVHNHCYRADEMSLMLGVGEEFGFKIRSFHHAVEAYKIADRLARAGTAASVWADWWGFKAEAFDTVRENAALLTQAGAIAIIHSDSALGIQRLNQEAAKAMYSGRRAGLDISDDQALRWITQNPAWALGVDDQTGTLEVGKLADVVVWSGNPFSVYTRAEKVWIDGQLVFEYGGQNSRTDFSVGQRDLDIQGGAHIRGGGQ